MSDPCSMCGNTGYIIEQDHTDYFKIPCPKCVGQEEDEE